MPLPRLAALVLAYFVAFGTVAALADDLPALTVDPAIAAMTADQKVAARQAAMKEDGKLLRGAGAATGQDAVDLSTKVLQNFTNFPALFADGATNGKSKALPVIWTEFDKFTAIVGKGRTELEGMRTAALTGDQASYLTHLKALAGVCGECHQQYRAQD